MAYAVLDLNEDQLLAEGSIQVVVRLNNPKQLPAIRLSLGDFAAGVASGRYQYTMTLTGEPRWIWVPTS